MAGVMTKTVCVFCSSSSAVAPEYFSAARDMGTLLAGRGWRVVYGGAAPGLMGELARAVLAADGRVRGIIPKAFAGRGLALEGLEQLVLTEDMRERKALMERQSDAFVALPGGFGTLEELLEIMTLKQIGVHDKPVVLVNTNGFFDPLLAMFGRICDEKFAKPDSLDIFHVASDAAGAVEHIEAYCPRPKVEKWW